MITTTILLNFNLIEIFMAIISIEHLPRSIFGEGFPREGRHSTQLKAVLSFEDEVAPRDRNAVDARLLYSPHSLLRDYLKEVEGLRFDKDSFSGLEVYGNRAQPPCKSNRVYVSMNRPGFLSRGLGLNITAEIKRKVEIYDMLDLDALNGFVLTGEYPEKRRDEYTGQWEEKQVSSPQEASA